jgi:hypothetical protein
VVAPKVIEARHETPAAEMPFVAEVAAGRGEVLTPNAATESDASAAEMTPAKAADVSATEPADVSATEPAAHMSATAETPAVSTASPAARKRISGQSPGESGGRCQDDHGFT